MLRKQRTRAKNRTTWVESISITDNTTRKDLDAWRERAGPSLGGFEVVPSTDRGAGANSPSRPSDDSDPD